MLNEVKHLGREEQNTASQVRNPKQAQITETKNEHRFTGRKPPISNRETRGPREN